LADVRLLLDHFGYSGKARHRKCWSGALRQPASAGRLSTSTFDNWMDFFHVHDFVDRDGKFQLQMLKYSAFAPLGVRCRIACRGSFPMGTAMTGLRPHRGGGRDPGWLIQKYLNKWISCSYEPLWHDHSSSAHWAYVWGIKGPLRRAEEWHGRQARRFERLQRHLYRDEVAGLIERLNGFLNQARRTSTRPTLGSTRDRQLPARNFQAQTGEPHQRQELRAALPRSHATAEDKRLLLENHCQ